MSGALVSAATGAIYIPVPAVVLVALVGLAILVTLVGGLMSLFGDGDAKKNPVSDRFFNEGGPSGSDSTDL